MPRQPDDGAGVAELRMARARIGQKGVAERIEIEDRSATMARWLAHASSYVIGRFGHPSCAGQPPLTSRATIPRSFDAPGAVQAAMANRISVRASGCE
jgi:hypothetical protein